MYNEPIYHTLNGGLTSDKECMNTCEELERGRQSCCFGRKTPSFLPKFCGLFLTLSILSVLTYVLFNSVNNLQEQCIALEKKLEDLQLSYVQEDESNTLCLPCGEISKGPFQEYNPEFGSLLQVMREGEMQCCAETVEQVSILLNLVSYFVCSFVFIIFVLRNVGNIFVEYFQRKNDFTPDVTS